MAEHECQAIATESTAVTSGPQPLSATGSGTCDNNTAAQPSAISRLAAGCRRCGNGAILEGAGPGPAAVARRRSAGGAAAVPGSVAA